MKHSHLICLLVVFSTFASFGCKDHTREEARSLIDFLDRVGSKDAMAARQQRVDELARLPLTNDVIKRIRDRCATMHQALIDAEKNQQEAKKLFAISPPPAGKIRIAIKQSDDALERARKLFPACNRGEVWLAKHYGGR